MTMFMAPFAFRRPRHRSQAMIAVAVIGYCSILASLIFDGVHWLEWPSVGLILVFVCLLGWMSASRSLAVVAQDRAKRSRTNGPTATFSRAMGERAGCPE
jgi:hypothetical protein